MKMSFVSRTSPIFLCASASPSVDSTMVVGQIARPGEPQDADYKGLDSRGSSEHRITFLGFVGRPKRIDADLLIPHGLMSNFAGENRRRFAKSKGLTDRVFAHMGARPSGFFGDSNVARPIY
jgi:hypothetical protein